MESTTAPHLPALCANSEEFLKHDYDFVIVGGGTAGLVVAARLSENPGIHVGVLEAGPPNIGDPMIMIPAMAIRQMGNPQYDWKHKTVPQKHAHNSSIGWPRGRGLGGSSASNFEIYIPGRDADYDAWEALGNKGWGSKDMLKYLKKHEHFEELKDYSSRFNTDIQPLYQAERHGTEGPIHTSAGVWRLPLEKEWMEACASLNAEIGAPENPKSIEKGESYHSLRTIDTSTPGMMGTRSYSTTGYFLPNAQRPNLRVLAEALVTKLIVEKDGNVTGIEFAYAGKSLKVRVKKEVILSAGTVKSPQILELSGIGNPAILSKAGVHCIVHNASVGEYLRDHPVTATGFELVDGELSLDMLQDPAKAQKAFEEYGASHSGPMASSPQSASFASYASLATGVELEALKKSIISNAQATTKHDVAVARILADRLADPEDTSFHMILFPASMNVERAKNQAEFFAPPAEMIGKMGCMIGLSLSRPLSVGTIHISSSSPEMDPQIDPAYLSHPGDIEILSKGLALVDKIVSTNPLASKIKRRYTPDISVDLKDDNARKDWIKRTVATQYHPVGTVAMGEATDERLKVLGTKGLRVIDASVMPLHVCANTSATVYAIAEKGSDLVKEDWTL